MFFIGVSPVSRYDPPCGNSIVVNWMGIAVCMCLCAACCLLMSILSVSVLWENCGRCHLNLVLQDSCGTCGFCWKKHVLSDTLVAWKSSFSINKGSQVNVLATQKPLPISSIGDQLSLPQGNSSGAVRFPTVFPGFEPRFSLALGHTGV